MCTYVYLFVYLRMALRRMNAWVSFPDCVFKILAQLQFASANSSKSAQFHASITNYNGHRDVDKYLWS